MLTRRPHTMSIALVLSAGALAAATATSAQAVGALPAAVQATADAQGNPYAVPPILRSARPSELAELRRSEAEKEEALSYRPPATARYSDAEINAFASGSGAGF